MTQREHPTTRHALRTVSGPHPAQDRYGQLDHYYWRCESCGLETTDSALREGCPRCAG